MARYAFNENALNGSILQLVVLVACEGIQVAHLSLFAKLLLEIVNQSKQRAQAFVQDLLQPSTWCYFRHFIEVLLIDERIALHQNDNYLLVQTYLPMIFALKKPNNNDQVQNIIQNLEEILQRSAEKSLQSISNESQNNLDWSESSKKHFTVISHSKTQIIADIKALEICLHCKIEQDIKQIENVLEQSIRSIEQRLQSTIIVDDDSTHSQDNDSTNPVDDEANPNKRRRLDENNSTIDLSNNNPKRKSIVESLQLLQNFLANIHSSSNSSMTTEQ